MDGERPTPSRAITVRRWALWLLGLAALTVAMLATRARLEKVHVALLYVLVVLGGSAAGGRRLGLTLAALAFVAFDYLFLSPYGTLWVVNPLDWLVLGAFLATSAVAAELLDRSQAQAETARRRAAEVARLSALGAETLNAGRAVDALTAISTVIRDTLGVAQCEVFINETPAPSGEKPPPVPRLATATSNGSLSPTMAGGLASWVAQHGAPAVEQLDGTVRLGGGDPFGAGPVRALDLPLQVRDRSVGVLRVAEPGGFSLASEQREFLRALAYYAALGVERVRLQGDAERVAALREADRLKDALLASVSHDLRTPLTTIKGLAEEILDGGDERAETIRDEADRLNGLVADLLDLSRINAGHTDVRTSINVVDDVVGVALAHVGRVAAERDVQAEVRTGEQPVLAGRFDFAATLRILVNLLDNAVKYSEPGTRVEMCAGRVGDRITIEIADRGPGVVASERERIFEPFYRSATTARGVRGTGLGLAIARRLAEAQDGTLTMAPRVDGGTTFTLTLPAVDLESTS